MGTEDANSDYYAKGSEEVATETALTIRKLEKRQKLTRNSKRLVIALVGLPARGKSFVARKLQAFLTWSGHACRIFNVGRYRREAYAQVALTKQHNERAEAGACDANFFDAKNAEATALRERVAELALRDMLSWLDNDEDDDTVSVVSRRTCDTTSTLFEGNHESNRIAIFDATNSTKKRRRWLLEECTSPEKRAGKPTGVVFVESLCDDEELLRENYRFKVQNSPDFKGMSQEEALKDLLKRVRKYEEQYETVSNQNLSYIKIFNLSTKLMVNHIYGRMAKTIVPALMAWNVGTRPIFLCRPGKTTQGVRTDEEDYVTASHDTSFLDISSHGGNKRAKGENLGPAGVMFRNALAEFVRSEGMEFMKRRNEVVGPSLMTGTSRTGLTTFKNEFGLDGYEVPFPLTIMTSTMPRAVETVLWDQLTFPVDTLSNLNPLDKGDFAGMELEEIQVSDPAWYARLEQEPFRTRFPGGESYRDLIPRLESCIIDMEQQVAPVLIVSHVSVLQVLIAYFRNSPVERCTSVEVPLHTVLKFEPSRGGGWKESRFPLLPEAVGYGVPPVPSESELSTLSASETPIWGDHVIIRSLSNTVLE